MAFDRSTLIDASGEMANVGRWLWHGGRSWADTLRSALKALKALDTTDRGTRLRDSEAACEAADVRALAFRYLHSDPVFASDLYAAAERHERMQQCKAG